MAELTLESYHLESQHGVLHQTAFGYQFDGQTGYVGLPSSWGGSGVAGLTLSAWVNPSAQTGSFQAILSAPDTTFIHLGLSEGGSIKVTIYTDEGEVVLPAIPVQPLNQWRHISIIAHSGASKLIIDGNQVGSNSKEFNRIIPTDHLCLGRGHSQAEYFQGKIANVEVWQEAHEHADIHGRLYQYLTDKPTMEVVETPIEEPETPTPEPTPTIFGFKSHFGKYLSAQPNGTVECNRDWLRGWEKFTVEDAGNGKVGLKSHFGKYLSAQPNGTVECNRDWLRGWEQFTIEDAGNGKIGLKSHFGKYLSAQPNGTVECNRDWLRGWEQFIQEPA